MNTSDIIAIVGLTVSVVGIPLTFILARRTKQRPELRYALDFDVILSQDSNLFDRGLFMTLGTYKIDSISRTRIALWNHRGDTIHKADILDSDPLRIQLQEEDQALQSRVLGTSRKQVDISAEIDPNKPSFVQVHFKFLDINDGAIIEIIHRGPSKPAVLGTLQGADIRNAGSVRLDSEALKAAQKSRIRRFLARYSPFVWLSATTVGMIITVWLTFTLLSITLEPAHLIDASKYHLNTIPGQVAFAKVVANTRAYLGSPTNFIWNFSLVILIIGVIVSTIALYIKSRKAIPWNITSYRPDDESLNESSTTTVGQLPPES